MLSQQQLDQAVLIAMADVDRIMRDFDQAFNGQEVQDYGEEEDQTGIGLQQLVEVSG